MSNQRTVIILTTIAIIMVALVATTFAQGEPLFELRRQVVASAGEPVADSQATWQLRGSLGEPIVSPIMTTTAYGLHSGYWALTLTQPPNKIYLPVMRKPHRDD